MNPALVPMASVVLSLLAAAGFTYLFNRPARVAAAWRRLFPDPLEGVPGLKSVLIECLLFIGVLSMLSVWAIQQMGPDLSLYIIGVLMATGILYDLVEEWRFRSQNSSVASV